MKNYLIIGNGRVAKHVMHYFDLLNITYQHWHRKINIDLLSDYILNCDIILCAISDDAIENFIQNHLFDCKKTIVHFSGSLVTEHAIAAHPLFSFGTQFFSLETYQTIPFVLEKNRGDFSEIFPDLSNPHFQIDSDKKSYYHALCVMGVNFSCLLWQTFFEKMQNEFGLPMPALSPVLNSVFANLSNSPNASLTGPLVRNDQTVIQKHLKALDNDPLKLIYTAFNEVFNHGIIKNDR